MEAQHGLTASSSALAQARRPVRVPAVWAALPAAALYSLFVLWPIAQVVWLALVRWDGFGAQRFVGLQNLVSLFADPVFRITLWHSIAWEAAAALLPTVLGSGLALLAVQSRARGLWLTVLIFPALLPATVVAVIWSLMYSPLAGFLPLALSGIGVQSPDWLGDPHLALGALFAAWLWTALGVCTLILFGGLRAVGREYLDLARVEGAGPLARLWLILPGLRRSIALSLLAGGALAAAVFDLVFVTTGGGPGYATLLLPLDAYSRAFGGQVGMGAASALVQMAIALAPALALTVPPVSFDTGERESFRARLWPSLALAVLCVLFLLPLLWLVLTAVQPNGLFASAPSLWPASWSLAGLDAAWSAGMPAALLQSGEIVLVVVPAVLLLAIPAGIALSRGSQFWRGVAGFALLLGLLQPMSVLVIPLFSLLRELQLLDSFWGIALPQIARSLAFAVLVIWAFVAQLPQEVQEAALLDGAGVWEQVVFIIVPLCRPALALAAIWTAIMSWNDYLLPTLVSQDGSLQTVPVLLGTMIGRYNTQYAMLAAGAIMALMPGALVYLLLRRPAARGLRSLEES